MAVNRLRLNVGLRHNASTLRAELNSVDRQLGNALRESVEEGTSILFGAAQGTINKKRGFADGTVTRLYMQVVGLTGRVLSSDKVALWLEEGTKRHKIPKQPKPPGKWLRFWVNGQIQFRKQVVHPGSPAYHWLYRAGEQSDSAIKAEFDNRIGNVLRRA